MGTTLRVAGGWVRDKLVGQEQGFHQRHLSKVDKMDIDIALDNCMGGDFATKLSRYLSKVDAVPVVARRCDAGSVPLGRGVGKGSRAIVGGRGGGGVCSISCMAVVVCLTIDPRMPTMLGRSMSGFHRPGRCCLHQAMRSAVKWPASHMKGQLHPTTKNRLCDGLALMGDSFNELTYFTV